MEPIRSCQIIQFGSKKIKNKNLVGAQAKNDKGDIRSEIYLWIGCWLYWIGVTKKEKKYIWINYRKENSYTYSNT